jgi:hypothetical protein
MTPKSHTVELLKRILVESEAMLPIEARTSEIRVPLASGILSAANDGDETLDDCALRR